MYIEPLKVRIEKFGGFIPTGPRKNSFGARGATHRIYISVKVPVQIGDMTPHIVFLVKCKSIIKSS